MRYADNMGPGKSGDVVTLSQRFGYRQDSDGF
jgi:hypothetical protein